MSKEISLLSTNGKSLGQISLDENVFGVEPNIHIMHLALRRQLNNARQGSACAKTERLQLLDASKSKKTGITFSAFC